MPVADGKLRVLIATTNGPVEVLLLTEEDAAIGRCVACIGGTTETADIAAAYHAFVVRPTGVIEGRFGHSCYRLDVSGRIDAGSSWQLGVLGAHALLAARRLAQENDAADGVVWATGSVRPVDLTVGPVSHVPEKLANSLDRLKQERAAGRRVLIALPAANAAEVPPELAAELSALGIEILTPSHVQGLFAAVGLQLPDSPGKSPVPLPGNVPRAAAPKPRRRWIVGAAAAAALLAVAATTAVVVERKGESRAPPSMELAVGPPASMLVADAVPFITTGEKARIRDEYMPAPGYKALATSLLHMAFVSGQPSQQAADRAAMDACTELGATSRNKTEVGCELYASGNVVVTRRSRPLMPPEPWLVRNPAVERPFVAAEIPMIDATLVERVNTGYRRASRSKGLVISPTGTWFYTSGQSGPDDAIRRTLERCGYMTASVCMVVAVDDTFVVPVPTSAKVVGFYRPEALFGVQSNARDEVARRLAGAANGWNAVAMGAGGQVGIATGAASERSAHEDALADCAKRDSNCRIAVLGPFLVETTGQADGQAQPQAPTRSAAPVAAQAPAAMPAQAPAAMPAQAPAPAEAAKPPQDPAPAAAQAPAARPDPAPAAATTSSCRNADSGASCG